MLLLIAALILVSTGCLNGEAELKVNADGTGSVAVEVFPPGRMTDEVDIDELEDLLGGSGASSDVQVEKVDRDGVAGFRVEVPFDDYQEAVGALQGGTTVAGQSVGLFSSLSVVELPDDQGWELAASLVPLDQVTGSSPGGATDLDGLLDAAGLASSGSGFDLSVALPGKVVSSNADSTDGGTATWRLDDPEVPSTLRMRTEPSPLVNPYRLVVGGAALAVLLGLLFAIVGAIRPRRTSRRERRRARKGQLTNPVSSAGWAGPGAVGPGAPGVGVARPGVPTPSDRPEPLPPLAPTPAAAPTAAPPTPPPFPPVVSQSAPIEPAPPEPAATPPGWYADPTNSTGHRWWDGERWTDHTS